MADSLQNKIATESYAWNIGKEGSYPTSTENKGCTRMRADALGCGILNNHGVIYTNNQLVMMDDLTQKVEKIRFRMKNFQSIGFDSVNGLMAEPMSVTPRAVTKVEIVTNQETRILSSWQDFDQELNITKENGSYKVTVNITAPSSMDYYNFYWCYSLGGLMNPSLGGISQQFSRISWMTTPYENTYFIRGTSSQAEHAFWANISCQFRSSETDMSEEYKPGAVVINFNQT